MKKLIAASVVVALLASTASVSFWLGTRSSAERSVLTAETWYCSMHPQIQMPEPGDCPICGMDLVPMPKGAADPGPRRIEMSAAAVELADIETVRVRRERVSSKISMVGMVEFDETAVRTITAWVPGRLDRLYVDYTGVPVAKGDHLADIYSPKLYEAQQQLFEALQSVDAPAGSSQRSRERSLGTLQAIRKRLQLLGLSAEQVAEIEARGEVSDHIVLSSPARGVVVEKLADVGDYVETGKPLYKVVALDQVWVKLDAYESDLPWLRYGQEVSFVTEAYPGRDFSGKVRFIDWVVDHHTRTIKVRLNVDNEQGLLKPGMFVRATAESSLVEGGRVMAPELAGKWISPMHPEIVKDGPGPCDVCGMDLVPAESLYGTQADDAEPPLVIPASAPLLTGKRAVVYIRVPGDASVYEGREIVLGPRAGEHYVVRRGLKEGELVVTRGNFKIDSALQIQAKPSMMQHSDAPEPVFASDEFLVAWSSLLAIYFEVSGALVEGDAEKARRALAQLGPQLDRLPVEGLEDDAREAWGSMDDRLRTAIRRGAEATDLTALREVLRDLTQVFLQVEARFGHAGDDLLEVFCPMAFEGRGASWLQSKPSVLNPYFGESMLRCGSVKSTFAAQIPSRAASSSRETRTERSAEESDGQD